MNPSGGRWNDNFRGDTRDFRGGRVDRFNSRDRPMGNRGGRFGGGRFIPSRSPERLPNRNLSPLDGRRDDDRKNKDKAGDGRWGEDSVGKTDNDEMEEMLKKARKEKIDDMMDRNKDMVKKTGH